jgi:hypothetical protein
MPLKDPECTCHGATNYWCPVHGSATGEERAERGRKSAAAHRELERWRALQLEHAQGLVREVIDSLDGSRHRCKECGIDVLRNKEEGRRLDTLAGIDERLGRIAGSMRSGT